jgi:hypothetical protein
MTPLRTTLLAAVVLALASVGTGQPPPDQAGQPPPDQAGSQPGKVRYEQREEGVVEIVRNANGTLSERLLSQQEMEARRGSAADIHTVEAGSMIHCEAYSKPRRMAPGQSGALKVMGLLSGHYVALPGSHIKLSLEPVEGLVFGVPVLQAAPAGTRPGKFQGKPVYDDFILFDVPLSVSDKVKAPNKRIFLKGKLYLEIHNGKTGAKVGAFVANVAGRVDVGKRLADGKVVLPGRSKNGKGTTGKKPGKTKTKPKKKINPGSASKSNGSPTRNGDAAVVEKSDSGDPKKGDADTDSELTDEAPGLLSIRNMGIGGGLLVILILVLLVRRK